jgi:hypothetical protein
LCEGKLFLCHLNQLLLSQRFKGSVLKPERALSRRKQDTNQPVRSINDLECTNVHLLYDSSAFRDQLYKHLETVTESDFDSFTTKLVQAGGTLEFLKYADALFEILLVGGLIQPGGSYVDDGAPVSPFTIFNAKEPAEVDDIKKYVEVLNKLIRRCGPFSRLLWAVLICLSIVIDTNIFKNLLKNLLFQVSSNTFIVGLPPRKINCRSRPAS